MESTHLVLGLSHIGLGALLIALSRPLVQGKIKPNPFYGVRFAKSFESESNWYAINRFGGQRLIFWSKWLIVLGAITLFLPLHRDSALTALLAFLPALLVMVPTWESYRFSKTL